jgi:hypothetical protein
MASGHRKRKARIVSSALASVGLTNFLPADQGNTVNTGKVVSTALYGSGAVGATFTEGSTTILSDAVSNIDGNWTLMGYSGETSANTAGFLKTGTIHRYMQYPGVAQASLTDSSPVVIYSKDGPQGYFNSAYLPTSAQVNGSGSLRFANQITGAAGPQTKLRVWIAGAVPTGSTGSKVTIYTGSNGPAGTALLTFSASATPLMQSQSFTFDTTTAISVIYSSSANTYNLNSFMPGVLVYITGSAN